MRTDPVLFAQQNESEAKRPRFVIEIEYDVESIYMTSHDDIASVPGVVMHNVLQKPSGVSQRIVPDEGRSEIGSFSFSLVDLDSVFTDEIREKLGDGKGLRGKKVRFWLGYARFTEESGGFGEGGFGDLGFGEGEPHDGPAAIFTEFQLFQTQIIIGASYEDGVYSIRCADITREQRKDTFDPKKTTLRDTVSASDATIPVYSTTGFQPVYHGTSYSDGPSSVVGYIVVEDEWVRYTGITADTFTGCTRGVLNTKAVAHTVDAASDADRRPKVLEGIYLELPAAKLAYAINTGVIHGTSPVQTLPEHWHLGISEDLVRLSDFTGIGTDLWDTTLDTSGFVVRFQGLTKIDGKKFLESELYMLLGCYSPIYSDGTIGLKRMNQVLADAAYLVLLDERNVVKHGAIEHDFSGMHNILQIDWNWNGEEFTRTTLFVDSQSVSAHGRAPITKLQFKGLHGSRHTEAIIRKRLDSFRDRYTSPPQRTTVSVLSSLNPLEVGDIARDRMPNVRDYAGALSSIDRSFEIQRRSVDYVTGDVTLELFGSSAPASVNAPNSTGTGFALPDAFYNSFGTELSTVCTIVVVGGVGVIQPGTYNLAGDPDMTASGAMYYYLGDLELADGATLTINNNVQLRVRGFCTINGDIDGVGRGKAGVADSSGWQTIQAGTPGFIGNSRGMDGVIVSRLAVRIAEPKPSTMPCALTQGLNPGFPHVDLTVSGSTLLGIPSDMRGTSGGAGGKVGYYPVNAPSNGTVSSVGGTGADSGAGLTIISRGLALGLSALIDLSGDDSASTSTLNLKDTSFSVYPGAGGAGSPGALLILLDGSSQSLPDVGGRFVAACGHVPVNGNPLPTRGPESFSQMKLKGWTEPGAGYLDERLISDVDLSNVAYRIQYIPGGETAQEDQDELPQPATGLSTAPTLLGVRAVATIASLAPEDLVEFYASIDNDRTNAVRVSLGKAMEIEYAVADGEERYWWVRVRRPLPGVDVFSPFFPASSTGGVVGIPNGANTDDINPEAVTALYSAYDSGPDTYTSGTKPPPPDYYMRIDGAPIGPDEKIRVLLTSQSKVTTGGALSQTLLHMDYTGNPGGILGGPIHDVTDTAYQSIATVLESLPSFPFPPVGVDWWVTVELSTSSSATWKDTDLKIEVIKR